MLSLDTLSVVANSEFNKKLLDLHLRENRGMEDPTSREALLNIMVERGCISVPFGNYFVKVFGEEIASEFSDYFIRGKCLLSKCICIPLKTLNDYFLGFILNNTDKEIDAKYKYPETGKFIKGRYIQMSADSYLLALKLGYIILVEGVYDELAVSACGLPCAGLSGSSMTKEVAQILDLIPTKIVISDEDKAGRKMFQLCQSSLTGKLVSVKLPTKDIDEYLRIDRNRDVFIDTINQGYQSGWSNNLVKLVMYCKK